MTKKESITGEAVVSLIMQSDQDQGNLTCPQLEVGATWLCALSSWQGRAAFLTLPGPNLSFSLPEADSSGLMQPCASHWVPALVFVN